MANGTGTISCAYCVHLRVGGTLATQQETWHCSLLSRDLPSFDATGGLNPICAGFREQPGCSQYNLAKQFAELRPFMLSGVVYGFPYFSRHRPQVMVAVENTGSDRGQIILP
mgnify:CR=1 FL=1